MFDKDDKTGKKHIHEAKNTPYVFFFSISMLVGMLIAYVWLDLYTQRKIDMSLIQIIKLVDKQNSEIENVKKHNPTVYKLMINGDEHNFSFTDFRLLNLTIDDIKLKR